MTMMTDYRATPEQWEVQEKFAPESEDACCLLELRSRIERLELGAGIYDAVIKTMKPPGLKEQALGAMGRFTTNAHTHADEMMRDFDIIRRALEQLND
jgi:hypothetical protein